jgi:membrane fusion protein (multidrug efflux system)
MEQARTLKGPLDLAGDAALDGPDTTRNIAALSPAERRARLRTRLFLALGLVVVAAAIAWGVWWYVVASQYASTDDAYVDATNALITPQVDGTIAAVPVHDTQHVKSGDTLVVIDPADAKLAVAQAEANYAQSVRLVQQSFVNVDAAAAQIAARQADVDKARIDYQRRAALASTGAVSGDELTTARNAVATAQADLAVARQQLAALRTLVQGSDVDHNPQVLAAKAALDMAHLNLARTVIRAPMDGVVAENNVQMGQRVKVGATLMSVVPLDQAYVNANFKESQLDRVHPGQHVTLISDLYGSSVVFHGRVAGIGGGTGSAFAVIPAQNATGNWIKVVQRLPVRIALDPRELAQHPLRVGLSMTAKIDLSN